MNARRAVFFFFKSVKNHFYLKLKWFSLDGGTFLEALFLRSPQTVIVVSSLDQIYNGVLVSTPFSFLFLDPNPPPPALARVTPAGLTCDLDQ